MHLLFWLHIKSEGYFGLNGGNTGRCFTVENEAKELDNDNKIAETATTDAHIDKRLWARGYETAQLWFKRVQKYLLSVMT